MKKILAILGVLTLAAGAAFAAPVKSQNNSESGSFSICHVCGVPHEGPSYGCVRRPQF